MSTLPTDLWEITRRIGLLVVAWAAFLAFLLLLHRLYLQASFRVRCLYQRILDRNHWRGLHALIGRQFLWTALILLRATGLLIALLGASTALTFSLSLFASTRHITTTLFDLLGHAAASVLGGIAGYLPNLAVLVVISTVTYGVIRLLHALAKGVETGLIRITGFYPEWASPTFDLLAFLIVMVALVAAFPYLPGGDSPALRGVSIFIGVLVSLGSSSAISNIVAGIILIYMRPYRAGDRVRIAETYGDVVSKNLLVTRVRTIKNVEVTVPNSTVLAAHIRNYSSEAAGPGVILNTTVTIGYDAPWRRVHELLIGAALATDGILADPKPFVFQTSLNDFHVSYEINAFTRQANRLDDIYSLLHQNIQDEFNKAGVEIMSPNWHSLRQGNPSTIPEAYRRQAGL
ncbi:MAG: mechanosensitive ion channel [Bryobacteraceae bacterium]|nr:mechanosensitive ion channel [Bryobacteraceae bacterium]